MNTDVFIIDLLLLLISAGLALYFWVKRSSIDESFSSSWRNLTAGSTLIFLGFTIQITHHFPALFIFQVLQGPSSAELIANLVGFLPGIFLVFNGVRQWFPLFSALKRDGLSQAKLYRNLVQEANSIFLRWDTDGKVIFINNYGEEFFGYPLDQLKGRHVIGSIVPETESSGRNLVQVITDIQRNPEAHKDTENENITRSGERVWVSWRNTSVKNDLTGSQELISIGVDVTERHHVQDALTALAESIGSKVGAKDVENTVKHLALAYGARYAWYGVYKDERKESIRTLSFWDGERMHHDFEYVLAGSPCEDILQGEGNLIAEGVVQRYPQDKALAERGVESYFGVRLKDSTNNIIGIIAVMDDHPMRPSAWSRPVLDVFANRIGAELERKAAEDNVFRLAHYDALTGLPNRLLFHDRLEQLIAHAANNRQYLALLFLDLDRFKHVNDSIGHAGGDVLLREVSDRLQSCVRASDTISRMGGDEFTVVLADIRDEEQLMKVAIQTSRKFIKELANPFYVDGNELFVSVSIGITVYPQDGRDFDYLVRHADIAMYHAKDKGGNTFEFFRPMMNQLAANRMRTEVNLRNALLNDEFYLCYQPIMDLADDQVDCVEALLRWRDPQRGVVKPTEFIKIAEDSGLIVPLGELVLRQACQQLRKWQRAGVPIERVSVNISLRQLEREGLVPLLDQVLKEYDISPRQLIIEITESSFMDESGTAIMVLKSLQERGFSMAIDDFGTGFSSFGQLRSMPVSSLKIDCGFIENLPEDENSASIVTAIMAMGNSLGLSVVAEGVETVEQLDFLRGHECNLIQGYYFSEPLQAEQCAEYVLGRKG